MKNREKVKITRIEYQLVEVYNEIKISLDELEEIIKLDDEDEIDDELASLFNKTDNIIYYAGEDSVDYDWNGKLDKFKIPHNEFGDLMGTVICIDNHCLTYCVDERIKTGNKKTNIHDFSPMKDDTLSNYVKMKRRTNTINNIIE